MVERGDVLLMRTIAASYNAFVVAEELDLAPLPLNGWTVTYNMVPPTGAELDGRIERAIAMVDARLFSRAEARAYVTGETINDATAALALIQETPRV